MITDAEYEELQNLAERAWHMDTMRFTEADAKRLKELEARNMKTTGTATLPTGVEVKYEKLDGEFLVTHAKSGSAWYAIMAPQEPWAERAAKWIEEQGGY